MLPGQDTSASGFSSSLLNWRTSGLAAAALILMLASAACHQALGAETDGFLNSWLAAQTNLQSWSAEVTQTRTLKTLAQPLVARGRIWFVAPNRFRWELGEPPQTIAIRQPEQMLVLYPRLKRAERYPLDGDKPTPWKDTLALLEAGFPRSATELESRFKILDQTRSHDLVKLRLEPRTASARRLMPAITLMISAEEGFLRATELQFADGSTLRNDFTNASRNPAVPLALLEPEIPSTFQVTEPGKRRR